MGNCISNCFKCCKKKPKLKVKFYIISENGEQTEFIPTAKNTL